MIIFLNFLLFYSKRKNMNSKLLQSIYLTVVVLISFIFMAAPIRADTPGFTVRSIIPENQIGDDQGYYNLLMKSGEKQEISTVLTNTSDKTVTIDISFSRATTNGNGLAIYDSTSEKKHTTLTYNIEDCVQIPEKEVTLAPHAQATVKALVSMPQGDLTGVLAGGFTFKQRPSSDNNSGKNDVSLTNEFRYILALVMQQNTLPVTPELKLSSAYADQVNARNVIAAQLDNISPTYIKDMAISATVKGLTNKKLSYSYTADNMKMAPNSDFSVKIPLTKQGDPKAQIAPPLKPGKYKVSMTVYSQKNENGSYQKPVSDGGKPTNYTYKWQFEKEFIIPKSVATKLNKSSTKMLAPKTNNWLVILLLIIILALLILVGYLKYNRKNKNDEEA